MWLLAILVGMLLAAIGVAAIDYMNFDNMMFEYHMMDQERVSEWMSKNFP